MSTQETLSTLQAADMFQDKTKNNFKRNEPLDITASNLPGTLTICKGARVMLTMNIDVADGITNGVIGSVTHIFPGNTPVGLPPAICVEFDEHRVGINARNKIKPPPHLPTSTVLQPQTEIIQRTPLHITRHQYPLMLAWAVTTHKIQGATTDKAVVSFDGAFKPGMAYVAISRVTSSSGLYFLQDHFNIDVIYCDHTIKYKLSAMPKANTLLHWNTLMPKEPIDHINRVYIASHNCEGFIPHLEDMTSNIFLNHMDIIAMQETWLQPQLTFSTPFPTTRHF